MENQEQTIKVDNKEVTQEEFKKLREDKSIKLQETEKGNYEKLERMRG